MVADDTGRALRRCCTRWPQNWNGAPPNWPRPRPRRPASRSSSAAASTYPERSTTRRSSPGPPGCSKAPRPGEYSADHTSIIRREPIGVIGSIAPWNYPLQMAGWKILPAVAAGNTIVLKPAEITPLTAVLMAEAATAVGFPDGVINVRPRHRGGRRPGPGLPPGRRHGVLHRVDRRRATGDGRLRGTGGQRVHLELGGKAPFVVFDDADLEAAVHGAVAASLINTGQDCTAATRAYVHRALFDAFVDGVADLYSSILLGPTHRPGDRPRPAVQRPASGQGRRDGQAGGGRRREHLAPGRPCRPVTWPPASGIRRLSSPERRSDSPDRPGRGLRSGADRVAVRLRRRGDRAGQ